jgi:hypothetical protein
MLNIWAHFFLKNIFKMLAVLRLYLLVTECKKSLKTDYENLVHVYLEVLCGKAKTLHIVTKITPNQFWCRPLSISTLHLSWHPPNQNQLFEHCQVVHNTLLRNFTNKRSLALRVFLFVIRVFYYGSKC